MAKLYAELTSDKTQNVASKSGYNWINIIIQHGNTRTGTLAILPDTVRLYDYKGNEVMTYKIPKQLK